MMTIATQTSFTTFNPLSRTFARRGPSGRHHGFVSTLEGEAFVARSCSECGGETMDYPSAAKPRCYRCAHNRNVYAAKDLRFSIDMGPQDSTNQARIANGTAGFNLSLPGVVEEYGPRNAYGQRTVKRSRPVANNEIGSTRRLKEQAKRAGLTLQETAKRAVG